MLRHHSKETHTHTHTDVVLALRARCSASTQCCVTPSITTDYLLVSGLNDSSRGCVEQGQRASVSSSLARRSLGNLGQLNPIPETEPGAADSGVTHASASGTFGRA